MRVPLLQSSELVKPASQSQHSVCIIAHYFQFRDRPRLDLGFDFGARSGEIVNFFSS